MTTLRLFSSTTFKAALRSSSVPLTSTLPCASISSLHPSENGAASSKPTFCSSYAFQNSSFNKAPQEERFQLAKLRLSTLLKAFQSAESYANSPLSSPASFVTKAQLHSSTPVADAPIGSQNHPVIGRDLHPSFDTQGTHFLPHPIWHNVYIDGVQMIHRPPKDWIDKLAFYLIKVVRFNFDWMSGYSFGKVTPKKILRRCIFLESVAGVPGSVAATARHLASLRNMQSDHGWVHTLLEEAENERMHLLTFLEVKKLASATFRWAVMLSQGVFYNFYFLAYLIYPRFCHRVVGYLEEEAVRTYTSILKHVDDGDLSEDWTKLPAPPRALKYWHMDSKATFRDVLAVIRADEAHHRDVNHTFADLDPDADNPFPPGH